MKVVILAGGLGTRISEETHSKPKPMVEIGGKPILLHIMDIYSSWGYQDFIICLGHKGHVIKEYFSNFLLRHSDVSFTFSAQNSQIHYLNSTVKPWKVTLVETGEKTMTGGRIKRVQKLIGGSRFLLTYGDGVADINLKQLVEYHQQHGKLATVTAVQPSGRFGSIVLSNQGQVEKFQEKPLGDGGWINGGFFVLQPEVFNYILGDDTIFEKDPLENLARDGQLMAYLHSGFWHPMDSLRDRNYLDELCKREPIPWEKKVME